VMIRQRLFGEIRFTLDLDLKGLWDIWHQQVDQTRNKEHKMLQRKKKKLS